MLKHVSTCLLTSNNFQPLRGVEKLAKLFLKTSHTLTNVSSLHKINKLYIYAPSKHLQSSFWGRGLPLHPRGGRHYCWVVRRCVKYIFIGIVYLCEILLTWPCWVGRLYSSHCNWPKLVIFLYHSSMLLTMPLWWELLFTWCRMWLVACKYSLFMALSHSLIDTLRMKVKHHIKAIVTSRPD